jgi:hypothetical protein
MEIFLGILGCIAFAFLIIGFQAFIIALLSDTNSKCIRCPLRDECFKAIQLGMHKFCDNAHPLDSK